MTSIDNFWIQMSGHFERLGDNHTERAKPERAIYVLELRPYQRQRTAMVLHPAPRQPHRPLAEARL